MKFCWRVMRSRSARGLASFHSPDCSLNVSQVAGPHVLQRLVAVEVDAARGRMLRPENLSRAGAGKQHGDLADRVDDPDERL